jgi:hypothetical protein
LTRYATCIPPLPQRAKARTRGCRELALLPLAIAAREDILCHNKLDVGGAALAGEREECVLQFTVKWGMLPAVLPGRDAQVAAGEFELLLGRVRFPYIAVGQVEAMLDRHAVDQGQRLRAKFAWKHAAKALAKLMG